MNLAVPAAPQVPRVPHGGADGAHAHASDKAAAHDFAAALSETASEQDEEATGGSDIAKPGKVGRMPPRLARLASIGEPKFDPVQTEVETNTRDTIVLPGEEFQVSGDLGGIAGAATAPGAEPGLANAMCDVPPAAAGQQGVRDLLAGLATDAPAHPDKATTLDDLVARLGKHLPAEARTAISAAGNAMFVEEDPANLEFVADLSDEVLASAKVIRQETHFQPVGQDVRRLPSMTPIANDDRLMEMSLAAATRTDRQGAGDRQRQDAPALAARPIETTLAAASAVGADQPPPGSSVGQQIADGVHRALAGTAPTEPAATKRASPLETVSTTFAPALRTIKLQLNPASLGMVTVMLSARDAELSIRLEAELPETVGMVEQDRGVLTARLAGAGYGVSEVTVGRIGTPAAGMDADPRDSGARAGGQSQDDGGRGRSNEGGASSFNGERADPHAAAPSSADESAGASASRGGAVEHPAASISYARRLRPV